MTLWMLCLLHQCQHWGGEAVVVAVATVVLAVVAVVFAVGAAAVANEIVSVVDEADSLERKE
jgi:hypothetical protein